MTRLPSLYIALARHLQRADWLLPTLARFLFAAIFLRYFWTSAATKLGDGALGLVSPSTGAYAQIFPRQMEAAGFDTSQLSTFHTLVVLAGTWAEFLLPALIVLGLLTRLSALGMIGFVTVQTLTDLWGHGAIHEPATRGAWFDRFPDAVIMDQRALWLFLLAVLVIKGAGPLSLDALFMRRARIVA
ncbi:DoxX family membrane protein [Roseovarius sp. SCSIO 43702]|uniref:DoxX family protein n=1 Tax=Roseovarius sp. SCSIO 43702 TaxID=2823043 RepID=UPI001C73D886|nr:DoxX family membrane protein [Roseovarius sp. SCSIO 43702]QYX55767.1 DoxX family membrane protein [Roseovarius sp. SCSIO 43702]